MFGFRKKKHEEVDIPTKQRQELEVWQELVEHAMVKLSGQENARYGKLIPLAPSPIYRIVQRRMAYWGTRVQYDDVQAETRTYYPRHKINVPEPLKLDENESLANIVQEYLHQNPLTIKNFKDSFIDLSNCAFVGFKDPQDQLHLLLVDKADRFMVDLSYDRTLKGNPSGIFGLDMFRDFVSVTDNMNLLLFSLIMLNDIDFATQHADFYDNHLRVIFKLRDYLNKHENQATFNRDMQAKIKETFALIKADLQDYYSHTTDEIKYLGPKLDNVDSELATFIKPQDNNQYETKEAFERYWLHKDKQIK